MRGGPLPWTDGWHALADMEFDRWRDERLKRDAMGHEGEDNSNDKQEEA